MSQERNRLPFDPMQPLELDDGTPVRLDQIDRSDRQIPFRVVLEADHPDYGCCGLPLWFYRNGNGHADGTGVQLQNVDPSIPPALRKARRDYAAASDDETPDFIKEDWFKPYADLHFPLLVEQDEVAMVSFFESERKLEADRRTVMRVGRYVRRFNGGKLKDEEVEQIAAASDVKLRGCRVKITQDADEIEQVYEYGPSSCMAGNARRFASSVHPARVYAGPDLALAYLGDPTDASARCVVWPDRKLRGTIYGDVSRMGRMLERMGYSKGSMDGARVRLIEDNGGVVMPYVDDAEGGQIDSSAGVVILGEEHDVCTANTHGYGSGSGYCCDSCGEWANEDETSYVQVTQWCAETWCDSCVSDRATYCEVEGAYVHDHAVVEVFNAAGLSDSVAEWHLDDFVEIDRGDHAGETWHVDATATDDDGNVWHVDELPAQEEETTGRASPPASLAELEAAGQMRLPWDGGGLFRVRRTGGGTTGLCHFGGCGATFPHLPQGTFEGTLEQAQLVRARLTDLHGHNHVYTIEPASANVTADEVLAIAA